MPEPKKIWIVTASDGALLGAYSDDAKLFAATTYLTKQDAAFNVDSAYLDMLPCH